MTITPLACEGSAVDTWCSASDASKVYHTMLVRRGLQSISAALTVNGFVADQDIRWLELRTGRRAQRTRWSGSTPFFLLQSTISRAIRLEAFDASTGKAWHRVSDDQYVERNSTATGAFAFAWDGNTRAANRTYTVPNGQYVVKVSVLKALGDDSNPAHWETWTSPVITIARP
jgi:hypothetical protein